MGSDLQTQNWVLTLIKIKLTLVEVHQTWGVQDRDRVSRQDAPDDDGLAEGAGATLAKRQQKSFEERAWLEQRFPQGLEEVEVQPLVRVDVVADSGKQNLKKYQWRI